VRVFLAEPVGATVVGGELIRNNKIKFDYFDVKGMVRRSGANKIRAWTPNRQINRGANEIHSKNLSRRRGKKLLRLKTCRTPVLVMEEA
jgi:hypothetical protein